LIDTLGYTGGPIVDGVVHFGHDVDKITAKLGTFDKLCVGSTCVTESELEALLDKHGIAPAAMSAAGEGKSPSGSTTDDNSGNSLQKEQAGTPGQTRPRRQTRAHR